MQTMKVTGLVLRFVNLRESDRLLTLLTPTGRVEALCRGSRKHGSSRMAASDVLVLAEYELEKGKGGWQVKEAKVERAHYQIRLEAPRVMAALHLVELCEAVAQPETDTRGLLELVLKGLAYLEHGLDAMGVSAWFALHLLRLEGLAPSLAGCTKCQKALDLKAKPEPKLVFDASIGGLACDACAPDAPPIDALGARWMRAALSTADPSALFAYHEQGETALNALQPYLQFFLCRTCRAGDQLLALSRAGTKHQA